MPLLTIKGSFGPNSNRPSHLKAKTTLIEWLVANPNPSLHFIVTEDEEDMGGFTDVALMSWSYNQLFNLDMEEQFKCLLRVTAGEKIVVIEEAYAQINRARVRPVLKELALKLAEQPDIMVFVIGDLMDNKY